MKFILYFFQAIFFYLVVIVIKILGLNISRKLFSFIFIKIGPLFKSRKIIFSNLDIAFKNLDIGEKSKIEKEMWSNYGLTFVEYFFLNKFRNQNLHIQVKGTNILDQIKKEKKPVIFISGHFSNFELMSMELTKYGINLVTIYRPLNNFFINPLMEKLRKKYVCKNQIKKGVAGVKAAIKFLDNDTSLALMIDQRLSEGEKIPFFGRDASTTTLPAQLSIKKNLNIVPVYLERKGLNFFNMEILKPIQMTNENKHSVTKRLNNIIEEFIIRRPGQWIWTHNRWK